MTYVEWPDPSTYGDDTAPVHSGLGVDLLRGNLVELQSYSPVGVSCWLADDVSVDGNASTATTFNDDAAILYRFPFVWTRARAGWFVRTLTIDLWAYTNLSTGTLRVEVAGGWIVSSGEPPAWPVLHSDTATNAITTTGSWVTLQITPTEAQVAHSRRGAVAGPGDAGLIYPVTYVTVRGKVANVPNATIYLSRLAYSEAG